MCEKSDSNLRSHLGKVHNMREFLYPSQLPISRRKDALIPAEEKKKLNEAAINAIVRDALPFNHFKKPGMLKFLSTIKPGYKGPHRKTVRKRLEKLYWKRRQTIRKILSNVSSVSLTADLWKSPSRVSFLCLTCHYLNDSLENKSMVISFRRFNGEHSGMKIRSFIIRELKKLDIQYKVRSITTDSGSNIKSATSGDEEFGLRITCAAHNINLIVRKSLWLFDRNKSMRYVKYEYFFFSLYFKSECD